MRNKPNMAFRSIFLQGYSAFLRPQRFEFGKKYKFHLCGYGLFSYLSKVCFAAIGACAFSVRGFGCAPFLYADRRKFEIN